jgi:hypothetical protein
MIPLTISIAILGEHTGLTHLETSAPLLAALGTAVGRRIAIISHVVDVPGNRRKSVYQVVVPPKNEEEDQLSIFTRHKF